MERVIKFRAWDKRNGQMFYSNEEQTVWGGGTEISVNTNRGKICGDFIGMQFTGLTDKNGKEIYEWDILSRGNSIGVVKFEDGKFGIRWEPNRDFWSDSLYHHSTGSEVIGNIHENPDLLK